MKIKSLNMFIAAALLSTVAYPTFADGGHSAHGKAEKHQKKQQEIMVHAKVNKVDQEKRTINVSHGPIAQLSWPAMTMDMKVAKDLDLSIVKAGEELMIALKRGDDGIYMISKLMKH